MIGGDLETARATGQSRRPKNNQTLDSASEQAGAGGNRENSVLVTSNLQKATNGCDGAANLSIYSLIGDVDLDGSVFD